MNPIHIRCGRKQNFGLETDSFPMLCSLTCGLSHSAVEIGGIFYDVQVRSHVKTGLKSIPGAILKNGLHPHKDLTPMNTLMFLAHV
jgi:hypothetical protein